MNPRAQGKSCRGYVSGLIAVCLPAILLTAICLFTASLAGAQAQRVVQGKVIGTSGQPQPNAVVYLKNDKSNDIKSFISIKDGSFRFGQLSSDTDYEVWAEYQGKKSASKTVSSFDSRKAFSFELKLK